MPKGRGLPALLEREGWMPRPDQLPPPGDWLTWLVMAGRGWGKTRTGAEWVKSIAEADPAARIALVAANLVEARSVMVEGESGLLAVCERSAEPPRWNPSLRRLIWPNGARAMLYSAAEPNSLRGPQHSHGWCDEIAKWPNGWGKAIATWDNLLMGLRLGTDPRLLATTTPRPVPLVRRLVGEDVTWITRGRTNDNAANLPPVFLRAMRLLYDGSTLGRQELDGELLTEREGALWSRALLDERRSRGTTMPKRTVVGVDPSASRGGDATGIIVVMRDEFDIAHVIADCTKERSAPGEWAKAVAAAFHEWQADRIVAESNQGGEMVEQMMRSVDEKLPIKLVHAKEGKVARAEPIAALYETGRVFHAGTFPKLEDQMCALKPGGDYDGPGRSPDRADALVYALTELMMRDGPTPQVRMLGGS